MDLLGFLKCDPQYIETLQGFKKCVSGARSPNWRSPIWRKNKYVSKGLKLPNSSRNAIKIFSPNWRPPIWRSGATYALFEAL